MPDSAISGLTAATAGAAANELEINEAGTSKKLTLAQIKTFCESNHGLVVMLASDYTNSNATANTLENITGLVTPALLAGYYHFRALVVYTAAATTTGMRLSVGGYTSVNTVAYRTERTLTATTIDQTRGHVTTGLPAAASATSLTAGNIAEIEGVMLAVAGDVIQVRIASEVASSAVVAKVGSFLEYRKLN